MPKLRQPVKTVPGNPDSSELGGPATTTSLDRKVTIDQLLSLVGGRKEEVEEKLSTASKTEADGIYDAYLKVNEILVGKIIVAESKC